ncbi:LPXTG cell wall anchor domain-containing protein [Microbacterium sp. 4R-513]|uniref:LPXTG cell wall anchor domain-containing protein n=1 Tax=Microbacterium sp. 4R-513 TaxID=2567934 RepID=UPI0013E1DEDB|nr:LPXTG cell wall anchor domain-containing protein [Microbacterium sp. 4R-513]QIG38455.1 LPXTG cell wall anchor domain-containing protein [Microbacterium sp. 4R-513]
MRLADGITFRANGLLSLDGGVDASLLQVLTAGLASDLAVGPDPVHPFVKLLQGAGLHVELHSIGEPTITAAPYAAGVPRGLPGDELAPADPIVVPVPVEVDGTGQVIIVETDGTTTLVAGVKETDSYTIALGTPPTARVYITITAAYAGGIPYAEISIDGGLTFHDQVILIFEIGETAPKTVIVRLKAGSGDHHPIQLLTAAPTSQPGPGMVVQTVSHSVWSEDGLYLHAQARNVYINADPFVPAEPEEPVEPGEPGQPGQPGGSGQPAAQSGSGADLAATGVEAPFGLLLAALMLLVLGGLVLRRRPGRGIPGRQMPNATEMGPRAK